MGGLDATLKHISELKLTQKAGSGMSGKRVYGELKLEMWRETIEYLDRWGEEANRDFETQSRLRKMTNERERRVKEWEVHKSKL